MSVSVAEHTVSVVIPCYNQAHYLRGALDSARTQTHPPADCIVVDDGSTDATRVVASSFGADLVVQANKGVSEARNAGLAAARGEFVVFLDADDELLPDALARGVAVLAPRVDLSAVAGRCQAMDAEGRSLPVRHHDVDARNLYREWLSKNFVWTPGAAMFRTCDLRRMHGFPPRLGPAADYAVYLELARRNAILVHEHDVVRYRQHDASMSRDPALMLRLTLQVLRRERREAAPSWGGEIERGEDAWRSWYGEQIVERLRQDLRARRVRRGQLGSAWTLLRYCPGVAARHARRKVAAVSTR